MNPILELANATIEYDITGSFGTYQGFRTLEQYRTHGDNWAAIIAERNADADAADAININLTISTAAKNALYNLFKNNTQITGNTPGTAGYAVTKATADLFVLPYTKLSTEVLKRVGVDATAATAKGTAITNAALEFATFARKAVCTKAYQLHVFSEYLNHGNTQAGDTRYNGIKAIIDDLLGIFHEAATGENFSILECINQLNQIIGARTARNADTAGTLRVDYSTQTYGSKIDVVIQQVFKNLQALEQEAEKAFTNIAADPYFSAFQVGGEMLTNVAGHGAGFDIVPILLPQDIEVDDLLGGKYIEMPAVTEAGHNGFINEFVVPGFADEIYLANKNTLDTAKASQYINMMLGNVASNSPFYRAKYDIQKFSIADVLGGTNEPDHVLVAAGKTLANNLPLWGINLTNFPATRYIDFYEATYQFSQAVFATNDRINAIYAKAATTLVTNNVANQKAKLTALFYTQFPQQAVTVAAVERKHDLFLGSIVETFGLLTGADLPAPFVKNIKQGLSQAVLLKEKDQAACILGKDDRTDVDTKIISWYRASMIGRAPKDLGFSDVYSTFLKIKA